MVIAFPISTSYTSWFGKACCKHCNALQKSGVGGSTEYWQEVKDRGKCKVPQQHIRQE